MRVVSLALVAAAAAFVAPARADDKVYVFAHIVLAPDRVADGKAYMMKLHDWMIKNKPPLAYEFYQSEKNPAEIYTYEIYANAAAADAHLKSDLPQGIAATGNPDGLFAVAPDIQSAKPLTP